jgi:dephospho-CoA kinase
MNQAKKPLIGVAGGIASGKSYVTELLAEKGAAVIVADAVAHRVLELEEVRRLVRERWGEAVFGPDGAVDRTLLGKIVFAPAPNGPRELAYLEQLIHPRVGEMIGRQIAELAADPAVAAIVLDVPLLFERGYSAICDTVIFVDASPEVRVRRAAERGWSAEELARREAAQLPVAAKRQQSQEVIDNSGSKESTRAQLDALWPRLLAPPPAGKSG